MGRMIADPKPLLDQLGPPPSGPDFPQEAASLRALLEQFHQMGALSRVEQRGGTRRRVVPQGPGPAQARTGKHWLTAAWVTPKAVAICAWVQPS
jgi:hypothetical protein